MFKYYLYSHFPNEKESPFHIIPSFYARKITFYPNNNPCWTKEKVQNLSSFEKQKDYVLALLRNSIKR